MALHELDFKAQVDARRRTTELEAAHSDYLAFHTEYREVMHEVLQTLLVHKPEDPLAFMRTYFEHHREKREAYKCK